MLKKTITYTDFNEMERTQDFYFNLTKIELMKMEASVDGGLAEKLKRISAAQDGVAIMEVMEDLIRRSYGVKTADGGFVKRPEDLAAFVSTEAYSNLFMELVTDAEGAVNFVKGILPADLRNQIQLPKKDK